MNNGYVSFLTHSAFTSIVFSFLSVRDKCDFLPIFVLEMSNPASCCDVNFKTNSNRESNNKVGVL